MESNRRELLNKEQFLKLRETIRKGGSRWAHLAYGYVRGTPYPAMERVANDAPSEWAVAQIIVEHGYKNPELKVYWDTKAGKTNGDVVAAIKELMPEIGKFLAWQKKPARIRKPRQEKTPEEKQQAKEAFLSSRRAS